MNGYLIAIILLTLSSTFFSATETAFSSANKIKLKNLAADDNKRAAYALRLCEDFDKLITAVLVGNTISNITMTTVATVYGIMTWGAKAGPTIATIMVTFLVLVFGEISPKILAREYAEETALALTPFVRALIFILTPLTFVFNGLKLFLKKVFGKKDGPEFSEDELLTIVEEAEAGGAIGEEQSELIANAIEFNDIEAIDILTPRVDIVAVEKGTPVADIKKVFKESGLSRLPVYEDDLDDIIGVINQKDLYNNNVKTIKDTEKIIKPVAYVAETLKAAVLLKKMQAKRTHIAIVVDEYGGTTGLVTLEDIIEEIVGDIYDEHDTVTSKDVRPAGDDVYMVAGGANLEDFFEMFDEEIEADATTINGWVMIELDRLAKIGDEFDYESKHKLFHVKVTKADARRALMTRITVKDKPEDED
ncbi:MAG: HlyC/CorC family transporter [Mogibacterium sp.]|nr:HlyC/CorC family transporter [Mogibacterium sp.]MBQ6499997.1 HlyC/CorC family transporter [Mogibacterium sp.]